MVLLENGQEVKVGMVAIIFSGAATTYRETKVLVTKVGHDSRHSKPYVEYEHITEQGNDWTPINRVIDVTIP